LGSSVGNGVSVCARRMPTLILIKPMRKAAGNRILCMVIAFNF
jgi:hypothetical protein